MLQSLKAAKTRDELAALLGFKPAALSYILYLLPDNRKYTQFEVPKKNGGVRVIRAPAPQLKLLQRRLANVLNECAQEIDASLPNGDTLSHGFRRERSIVTNARPHRNQRYVLNFDLADFFPSINFGRVRGFFLKNRAFLLAEPVATAIAQIACHDNELPQGSPCSPAISNLIAHLLDIRMAMLARGYGCTYTRYADDLTISTHAKSFPKRLALQDNDGEWKLGRFVQKVVRRSGFSANSAKTRMHCRANRQLVTGLTVNTKVNVRAEYYRTARALCHRQFMRGECERTNPTTSVSEPVSVAALEGIVSFIHYVKDSADYRAAKEKRQTPLAITELYRRLLFYKLFVLAEQPIVVCEGKTDSVYLRFALKRLAAKFPSLVKIGADGTLPLVRFFNYQGAASDILRLTGGTGPLSTFLSDYGRNMSLFRHVPKTSPVIVLIDNDDGAHSVFKLLKEKFKVSVGLASSDQFFRITQNLYLVKTVEQTVAPFDSYIEQCFPNETLTQTVEGKSFNASNGPLGPMQYGKVVFAERVVRAQWKQIDFSGFTPLLTRIATVVDQHNSIAQAA